MYFPFVRGRMHEIFALGRLSQAISKNNVIPIVEPVGFTYVKRFKLLAVNKMPLVLIVNPRNPEPGVTSKEIHNKIIEGQLKNHTGLSIGILIDTSTKVGEVETLLDRYASSPYSVTLIHYRDFSVPRDLVRLIKGYKNIVRHVFEDDNTTSSYQSNFGGDGRATVILKDSFDKKANNADYPNSAYEFSDIHKHYKPGYDGFGDYTIVGDTTSKGGSFARTVAIHFTFPQKSKIMIQHFLSRTDQLRDNAGKFSEAVGKLATVLNANPSFVVGTAAQEFATIDADGIVKTLGYAKELSIMNHIEVYMSKI